VTKSHKRWREDVYGGSDGGKRRDCGTEPPGVYHPFTCVRPHLNARGLALRGGRNGRASLSGTDLFHNYNKFIRANISSHLSKSGRVES
jgi:hypothetical protein